MAASRCSDSVGSVLMSRSIRRGHRWAMKSRSASASSSGSNLSPTALTSALMLEISADLVFMETILPSGSPRRTVFP
ncbi:Uncharacterised protein [Mycobacteroides abscessus subsp. abscessus]|nr:Uncharacterised protein [Mycobacteroides abscessus subsp. abscessus]